MDFSAGVVVNGLPGSANKWLVSVRNLRSAGKIELMGC
jgi:hypothetical protein